MPHRKKGFSYPSVVVPLKKRPKRPVDPREGPYNKGFGERLKRAREDRGFTQAQMALALGIGEDGYKKHEYGKTAFPLYLIQNLALITDRSVSHWITGHGS